MKDIHPDFTEECEIKNKCSEDNNTAIKHTPNLKKESRYRKCRID